MIGKTDIKHPSGFNFHPTLRGNEERGKARRRTRSAPPPSNTTAGDQRRPPPSPGRRSPPPSPIPSTSAATTPLLHRKRPPPAAIFASKTMDHQPLYAGNTLLLPSSINNPVGMMAQVFNVYKSLIGGNCGDVLKDISPLEIIENVKTRSPPTNESSAPAKTNDGEDQVFLF